MELALLVLFVVFACSTLLVSTALIEKDNMKQQQTQLKQQLALEQLAEEILAGTTPDGTKYPGYAAFKWNGSWTALMNGGHIDTSTFTAVAADHVALLITDLSGAPQLTVELKSGKIIQWNHH